MSGPASLKALLDDGRVWTARGQVAERCEGGGAPTGFAGLDAALPGRGWPRGAITELLAPRPGIGEISLLLPALVRAGAAGRRLALVAPPARPCAPAWAAAGIPLSRLLAVDAGGQALWAAAEILRSQAFGAVLLWAGGVADKDLRRLQLSAERGEALLFLLRPPSQAPSASPAALRLRLAPGPRGALQVEILKSRGGVPRVLSLDVRGPGGARPSDPPVPIHAVVMPVPAMPDARSAA